MLVTFLYVLYQFSVTVCRVEVKIKQGVIAGTTEATVFNGNVFYAFYGVPYAQPPIGKLRFKNPVALKPSNRLIDATTEYHGACAQGHIVHKHGMYGFEDCLHLNIFTPYLPKFGLRDPKAVILWIHGYAFTSSFSHIHGGDFLIDNDVILVTLTHRISVFGYLKLNDTDNHTNMGLKDIIMGLKWVKRNIEQFGGDKNRVTVMGCGSGATLISLLMMTKFRTLFSKAILHSGSVFSPSLFQGDQTFERSKLEKAIHLSGFTDIASVPSKDIVAHSSKIYTNKHLINAQRPLIPFTPINEGDTPRYLMSEKVINMKNFKRLKDTPIMMGFTSQEGITEALPFIHNPHYMKSLNKFKYMVPFSNQCKYKYGTQKYEEIGNMIRRKYFRRDIGEDSLDDFLKYVSDLHRYPIYKFIRTYINVTGSDLYVYKFNYIGGFNAAKSTALAGASRKIKGAAQGDEICYILKCDPLWEYYVRLKQDSQHRDRVFITQIAEMWANFAKFGAPTNADHNVTWSPMTKDGDKVFFFGKNNKLVDSRAEREMFEFWNDLYGKYYSNEACGTHYKDEL